MVVQTRSKPSKCASSIGKLGVEEKFPESLPEGLYTQACRKDVGKVIAGGWDCFWGFWFKRFIFANSATRRYAVACSPFSLQPRQSPRHHLTSSTSSRRLSKAI